MGNPFYRLVALRYGRGQGTVRWDRVAKGMVAYGRVRCGAGFCGP